MIELNGNSAPLRIYREKGAVGENAQQQQHLRLRRATREFEAIFISQLLKNMRRVSFTDQENGFGKDVMLEMADEAVSRQLAQTGMLGVGDMLYRHLSERIDADGADERLQLPACRAPALRRHAPASYGRFHSEIRRAAQETGLSPRLIGAVIKQESAGDPKAVSRKGAVGLMQLMPAIAVQMGVRNRFDPAANVLGGAKYLRALLVQFKKLELTLVAYNAGPEAVKRHGSISPYPKTCSYVERIVADLNEKEKSQ